MLCETKSFFFVRLLANGIMFHDSNHYVKSCLSEYIIFRININRMH